MRWRSIAEDEETGGGGGGRGGIQGRTGSACSMTTVTKMNTTMRRMGRGHKRERTMGGNPTTMVATSSVGRPSAAWGIGHRSSAPSPPPPSSMTTMTTIAATVGGRRAPPLRSVLSRRMPLVIVDVANRGRRWRHGGIWGVVIRVVEEEEVSAGVLVVRFRITPGWTMGGRGAA